MLLRGLNATVDSHGLISSQCPKSNNWLLTRFEINVLYYIIGVLIIVFVLSFFCVCVFVSLVKGV